MFKIIKSLIKKNEKNIKYLKIPGLHSQFDEIMDKKLFDKGNLYFDDLEPVRENKKIIGNGNTLKRKFSTFSNSLLLKMKTYNTTYKAVLLFIFDNATS